MVAQKKPAWGADPLLAELASLLGVHLCYRDAEGRLKWPSRDAVLEVMQALLADAGAEALPTSVRHFPRDDEREWMLRAIRSVRTRASERLLEPVVVAWDGLLRLDAARPLKGVLTLQISGEEQRVSPGSQLIPLGRHRLKLEIDGKCEEATVISAPRVCWRGETCGRRWGVFVPTYALHSPRDWGAGDMAELEAVLDSVADAGGDAVATLPLLACYLDRPSEPSPYAPVSHLFWNEFFLAVDHVPEWRDCRSARELWQTPAVQAQVAIWRGQPLVDYEGVMALKRRVLAELAQHFFTQAGSERRRALQGFIRELPEVVRYAEFRAQVEANGRGPRALQATPRRVGGSEEAMEELSESGRYHVYVQWQMDEQLRALSARTADSGRPGRPGGAAGLFLDLPVGVHPQGFDVWDRPDLFVPGMSIGAPPDAFFSGGQCWGSPPLHPSRIREDGHSRWARILEQHMRHAKYLRIDHVMSLHRSFWVPDGRPSSDGVYVDQPADELYAVLCLESHRQQTVVVGEDLGTVPPGVRPKMRRHGVLGTWVFQGAVKPRARQAIQPPPRHVVATLGTHDMFPLAAFLRGDDICSRLQTGQIDKDEARRACAARLRTITRLYGLLAGGSEATDPERFLAGVLSYLGASEADFLLINLDDLLLRTEPQNIPGTGSGGENWRRKTQAEWPEVALAIESAARSLAAGQSRKSESSGA